MKHFTIEQKMGRWLAQPSGNQLGGMSHSLEKFHFTHLSQSFCFQEWILRKKDWTYYQQLYFSVHFVSRSPSLTPI